MVMEFGNYIFALHYKSLTVESKTAQCSFYFQKNISLIQ